MFLDRKRPKQGLSSTRQQTLKTTSHICDASDCVREWWTSYFYLQLEWRKKSPEWRALVWSQTGTNRPQENSPQRPNPRLYVVCKNAERQFSVNEYPSQNTPYKVQRNAWLPSQHKLDTGLCMYFFLIWNNNKNIDALMMLYLMLLAIFSLNSIQPSHKTEACHHYNYENIHI